MVIDGMTAGAIAHGLRVSQVTLTNDGPAAEVESQRWAWHLGRLKNTNKNKYLKCLSVGVSLLELARFAPI